MAYRMRDLVNSIPAGSPPSVSGVVENAKPASMQTAEPVLSSDLAYTPQDRQVLCED